MSRDPYHDFASDLRASLASAQSLCRIHQDQLKQGSSSARQTSTDVGSTYDRLNDAIEGLRQDVEDVKQSVLVVERSGAERFGVSPEELHSRKRFVEECESEIKALSKIAQQTSPGVVSSRERHNSNAFAVSDDEDANEAFEREQQQILMSRQDNTLDTIGSTLNNLRSQAGMMGQEIGEQIEIIEAFDGEVDQSQGRLSKAMRKMDIMVQLGDEKLGGWCVWILIAVLFLLLLVVILV